LPPPLTADRSVFKLNLAISALASPTKSADEPFVDVMGVEPPGVDMPPGVEVPVVEPPFMDACLAAFSARRFCLDAEGAILMFVLRW
jgi:hypothetical protein